MKRARCLLVALALAPTGCGKDEALSAAQSPGPDAGAHDAAADAPDPELDAGPKIRTVERRNPFGNTAAENNLMVDGDFEWSSGFGQHGWRAMSQSGELGVERETGGLCRSGVTCGVLRPGAALIGMAAAPRDKPMLITLYTKPPTPDCSLTSIALISCTSAIVFSLATIPPANPVPAADGWCQHRATAPPLSEQPCLYITGFASGDQRILIDDATIVVAEGTGSSPLAASPPSPELWQRVQRDVRFLHERALFGRVRSDEP